jgi:hypothetical protein
MFFVVASGFSAGRLYSTTVSLEAGIALRQGYCFFHLFRVLNTRMPSTFATVLILLLIFFILTEFAVSH